MEIIKKQNGTELTLALSGRLDTNTSRQLEAELRTSVSGITSLIFDFADLDYVSSDGLRVLVNAQMVMNNQGTMVIRNSNSSVLDVFNITGLIDILNVEE